MPAMVGKYARLCECLRALKASKWQASFADIEDIVGADLPASARRYAAWWSNGGHSHARAWMDAGFETCDLSISARTVVFRRTGAKAPNKPTPQSTRRAVTYEDRRTDRPEGTPIAQAATALPLCGRDFDWIAEVQPDAGADGRPCEYMPQNGYAKAKEKPLNKHGHGPFCRFSIAGLPAHSSLYAVTVDRSLVYVGITGDLRKRWGSSGYAKIQPANCYGDGQSTNCKINHEILLAAREGHVVELWTRRDSNLRPLERLLIRELDPPWNDQR